MDPGPAMGGQDRSHSDHRERFLLKAAFSRTRALTIFFTRDSGIGLSGEKWVVAPLTV
jgi:hypothetical protein